MNTKKLNVFINKQCVGSATQDANGDIEFRYNDAAQRALSLSLPLTEASKTFKRKACRGYFDGLLPESAHVRNALAKHYQISAYNNFSLLKAIGDDCAGAVSFHPPDSDDVPQEDFIQLDGTPLSELELEQILINLPKCPLGTGLNENMRLSLAGAQDKTALIIKDAQAYIPHQGVPSTHILKPAMAYFEETVQNEYICLQAAKKMKLDVPHVQLLQAGNTPYFLIERYDRDREGDRVRRIHQEDFCQALNIPCALKYEKDKGACYKQCFELIHHCDQPILAKQELLQRVIFNYLIGNNDAHGKNFSFLYAQDHSIQLAPTYDILCTQVYPEISKESAMKMGRKYIPQKVSIKDIKSVAANCQTEFELWRSIAIRQSQKLPDVLAAVIKEFPNQIGASILNCCEQNCNYLLDLLK